MLSVVAHELYEVTTDPDLNAWLSSSGEETGDLCCWTFGATYAAAGAGYANINLGGRDYLIQRIIQRFQISTSVVDYCVLGRQDSLPAPSLPPSPSQPPPPRRGPSGSEAAPGSTVTAIETRAT